MRLVNSFSTVDPSSLKKYAKAARVHVTRRRNFKRNEYSLIHTKEKQLGTPGISSNVAGKGTSSGYLH